MESAAALQTLLECLRARGALLTRADIEWAFNTDKNVKQIEAFIQRYLNNETLLSLEERDIYESLKSKDLLGSDAAPLGSRPTNDLQVSKDLAALEHQNEVLKRDIERVKRLKSDHAEKLKTEKIYKSEYTDSQQQLQTSYMSERDQNSAAIDDLEANFRAALADMQDASGKLNFQMSAMSEITRADDRILARLQSMVSDILIASETSGEDMISDASQYAEILATLEEQIIKTRLDRVFLNHVTTVDIEDMEGQPYLDSQEFNDLVVEVAAVANMRAKDGLLQPILQRLTTDNKLKNGIMAQRCSYILNTIALLDTRNKEAEAEITNRNNMQYVSSRMQMLFDLSMRDYHDAIQQPAHRASEPPQKPPSRPQSQTIDKETYIENKIWRSMGIASLTPGESASKEVAGQASKLKSKEELYAQLRAAHSTYIQEESGVLDGLGNSVNRSSGRNAFGGLEAVEDKVRVISEEVLQLAKLATTIDSCKTAVINNLKNKETYGN